MNYTLEQELKGCTIVSAIWKKDAREKFITSFAIPLLQMGK